MAGRLRCWVTAAFAFFVATSALAQEPFPRSSGHVNDFANLLDGPARSDLESLLEKLEAETTIEVYVATVATLDNRSVEEYANALFRDWGIGQRDKDNGVLILVASAERRMRIEVGYGLEPVLPDGRAGQVMREEFLPAFERQDFTSGIVQGTQRVVSILRAAETTPSNAMAPALSAVRGLGLEEWLLGAFAGLFVAAASFEAGVGLSVRAIYPIIKGVIFAGIGIAIDYVLAGPAPTVMTGVVILLPVAACFGFWGVRNGRLSSWRSATRGKKGGRGWIWGTDAQSTTMAGRGGGSSDGSGSSGGDSGGGGGSSSGGGSSGGGGASGSW